MEYFGFILQDDQCKNANFKMEAQVGTLHLLAQPREGQQQFENKKQPELTENRTVWKSDKQGDKETLIQTGRRGGDRQPGRRGKAAAS